MIGLACGGGDLLGRGNSLARFLLEEVATLKATNVDHGATVALIT